MEGIEHSHGSLDQLVSDFNIILVDALDEFAPKKTKVICNRHYIPWFNDNITNLIKERCKAENIWRMSKSNTNNFKKFYRLCRLVSNTMDIAEKAYYKDKLVKCKNDYKQLFSVCNNLLGRGKDLPLPPCKSKQQLANEFNDYIINKISKIRNILFARINDLNSRDYEQATYIIDPPANTLLTCYRELTVDEVVILIMRPPTKSCESDPIPTSLLKPIIHEVVPHVTDSINISIKSGCIPSSMKGALVRPLLKKATLGLIMKNYHPVLDLNFCSNVIKWVVADQLVPHVESNNLMEPNQSTYRTNNSTETTILKVKSDILGSMDKGKAVCLVLLDLSAAFDTTIHSILLQRLQDIFGICNRVLEWICLYIMDCNQKVVVDDFESDPVALTYGIPQGSVLGPILLSLYTSSLGDLCRHHLVEFQLYADDQQVYLSFEPSHTN